MKVGIYSLHSKVVDRITILIQNELKVIILMITISERWE
jgi:hypothetical protein